MNLNVNTLDDESFHDTAHSQNVQTGISNQEFGGMTERASIR